MEIEDWRDEEMRHDVDDIYGQEYAGIREFGAKVWDWVRIYYMDGSVGFVMA